jgi:TrkA-N domain/RyR domain
MSSADNGSLPSSPGANGSSPADARSQTERRGSVLRSVRKSARTVAGPLARGWRDYHWWVVGLAAVAAFVLGLAGFLQRDPSPTDAAYNSLKLFVFHESEANTGVGVCLNIARFLAPAVAGYAALTTLGSLFYERWLQMQVPRRRGHIVLCGLGYVGNAFLESLRDAGKRVVVIEKDAQNPNMQLCLGLGVPVIVGDAQQTRTLQAAGVERAALLLAVTPNDAVNTEIVTRAQVLTRPKPEEGQRLRRPLATRRRGGQLRCLAQVGDPDLCMWLRIEESKRSDAESALDFFNAYEISARLLLDHFPFDTTCERPHILVAHLDARGPRLIFHAARQWYDHRHDNTVPLLVTVVDDHAEQQVDSLLGQYPVLEKEKVCEFILCSASVRGIERRLADKAPTISRAYVTAYDDAQAMETALKLCHEFDAVNAKVPLVVALSGAEGVASLVKGSSDPNMDVFRTLQKTCTADFAEGGSFETMAEAIHRRYCDMQPGKTKPPPWSELGESFKESNRAQARDIAVKLDNIGCHIVPLRDWGAIDFTFTHDEVDKLAEMEHDRWWYEKLADGWSWGEEKDDKLKKNPYMVEPKKLPRNAAEWDRGFVRAIPSVLASVGLQVIRVPTT